MERNRNDQQEKMYPCEINKMAKHSNLRVAEIIQGMSEGDRVFRVDFISIDPKRVFGAAGVLFEKDMSPFKFTDTLRAMADNIDAFMSREK